MEICYLSSNQIVVGRLFRHFAKRHHFVRFNPSDSNFGKFDAVLLVEPFEVNETCLSVFSIWKRFLKHKFPTVKLIVAGFPEAEHSNQLNLLDLSDQFDLEGFFRRSRPVTEDWETEIIKNGDDVLPKLKVFFRGHHHESIIDTIATLRSTLNNAYLALEGSKKLQVLKRDFSAIWQEMLYPKRTNSRLFFSRWHNYRHFFECLPFYSMLLDIKADEFAKELNAFFSGGEEASAQKEAEFRALDGYKRLDELTKLLDSINRRYINVEKAGTVLLIDDDPDFHQQMEEGFPGLDITGAFDAAEALEKLEARKFDLVLLDLRLNPDKLDGIDLIEPVKRLHPETPLIIVTTNSQDEVMQKTLRMGANHFLRKSLYNVDEWYKIFLRAMGKVSFSEDEIFEYNAEEEQQDGDRARILVVEDEDDWFDNISHMTRRYAFERAATLMQAKDLVREKDYDLILLDLYFKDNDNVSKIEEALDLIPFFKNHAPNVPVIVVTIDGTVNTSQKAIRRGADNFLLKTDYNSVTWLKTFEAFLELKRTKERINALNLQLS